MRRICSVGRASSLVGRTFSVRGDGGRGCLCVYIVRELGVLLSVGVSMVLAKRNLRKIGKLRGGR